MIFECFNLNLLKVLSVKLHQILSIYSSVQTAKRLYKDLKLIFPNFPENFQTLLLKFLSKILKFSCNAWLNRKVNSLCFYSTRSLKFIEKNLKFILEISSESQKIFRFIPRLSPLHQLVMSSQSTAQKKPQNLINIHSFNLSKSCESFQYFPQNHISIIHFRFAIITS